MVAIKRAALLAGLAQLISISAAQDAITDDSHFYGQSPPVYPSRRLHQTWPVEGKWPLLILYYTNVIVL